MASFDSGKALRTERRGHGFTTTTLAFALASASAYACYSSELPASGGLDGQMDAAGGVGAAGNENGNANGNEDGDASASSSGGSSSSADGDGAVTTTGPGTPVSTSDLPCDVGAILQANCTSCHGAPLLHGAPVPLLTHADLAAPSKSDPTTTVAASALAHLTSTDDPMPPLPASPLAASDIATFRAWVQSGFPAGSCVSDAGTVASDASAGDDDSSTPVVDSGPIAPVCTSGKTWTGGSHGSALMHPGRACLACHAANNGPSFDVAGTVFPTLHEPDDCDGANLSGTAYIDIIDAKSVETHIAVDSVGNFHKAITGGIAMPFSAAVVIGTKTRKMTAHQKSADCNSCHTVDGANGAPGRIIEP